MSISLANLVKYSLLVLAFVVAAVMMIPESAAAAYNIPAGGQDLGGFAWSAYNINPGPGVSLAGVGWVSMNCESTNSCASNGGVDYAVRLRQDGNLVGYAWSSNVGWIRFNPAGTPVGSFPVGAGVTNANARAIGGDYDTSLNFSGWARVCSAAPNPATCSGGNGPNVNAGGWDGWISLGGSVVPGPGTYGVTMTPAGGTADSYAWGGPTVMGWLSFDQVVYQKKAPVVVIIDPLTPQPTGLVTITYNPVDGGGDDPDTCAVTNNVNADVVNLTGPFTSASTVTVDVQEDATYTVTCQNNGGSGSDDVDIDVFYDLVVGVGAPAMGTMDPSTGIYDTISFSVPVSGVPNIASNVSYEVDLDGQSPQAGNFDAGDAIAGVYNINEVFSNVGYSVNPLTWTIRVDHEPTSDGRVDEGGGAAEDNTRTGTINLPAPDPVITIDVDSIVRSGTAVNADIEIFSVGPTTCTLFGPGLTGLPDIVIAAGGTYSDTVLTDELNNAATVAVSCTVVGSVDPYRQGEPIEVTPAFQEV